MPEESLPGERDIWKEEMEDMERKWARVSSQVTLDMQAEHIAELREVLREIRRSPACADPEGWLAKTIDYALARSEFWF